MIENMRKLKHYFVTKLFMFSLSSPENNLYNNFGFFHFQVFFFCSAIKSSGDWIFYLFFNAAHNEKYRSRTLATNSTQSVQGTGGIHIV